MGTKEKPGAFDCHASALPDEPLFTLLARDPLAPRLTKIWALIRAGKLDEAREVFRDLITDDAAQGYALRPETDTALEAFNCGSDMKAWRSENFGKWRKP